MGKLFDVFSKFSCNEENLYELVAADERARRGYSMDSAGFNRYIIHLDGKSMLLQVEHYADGHYHISIQGDGAGYVMFYDERFIKLLEQF